MLIPRVSYYPGVTFVISAAGAISPDAQGLLAAVSRCSGGSLPSSLYPLSSWSASQLIPYVRQAVTFSVRRHLAACVRDAYSSAEAAPWLSPAQDALPPVPLLDSSDALDVVAKDLAVALSAALAKTFASFATTRHDEIKFFRVEIICSFPQKKVEKKYSSNLALVAFPKSNQNSRNLIF